MVASANQPSLKEMFLLLFLFIVIAWHSCIMTRSIHSRLMAMNKGCRSRPSEKQYIDVVALMYMLLQYCADGNCAVVMRPLFRPCWFFQDDMYQCTIFPRPRFFQDMYSYPCNAQSAE